MLIPAGIAAGRVCRLSDVGYPAGYSRVAGHFAVGSSRRRGQLVVGVCWFAIGHAFLALVSEPALVAFVVAAVVVRTVD